MNTICTNCKYYNNQSYYDTYQSFCMSPDHEVEKKRHVISGHAVYKNLQGSTSSVEYEVYPECDTINDGNCQHYKRAFMPYPFCTPINIFFYLLITFCITMAIITS